MAEQVLRLEASPDLRKASAEKGRSRAHEFSWERHIDELLGLATRLAHDYSGSSSEYRATA
jgi:glycosyltransferase involved in cell wall biosynthesis